MLASVATKYTYCILKNEAQVLLNAAFPVKSVEVKMTNIIIVAVHFEKT